LYEPASSSRHAIAALRQLQVSLAEIKAILPLEPVQAAERVREVWPTEAGHTARRALAAYLIDELSGRGPSCTRSERGRCPIAACCA
jgi:hypothetical protein